MPIKQDAKKIFQNLPQKKQRRTVNGFAGQYNYQDKLPDGTDNPQTKLDYCGEMLCRHIQEAVKAYEHRMVNEAVVYPDPIHVDDDDDESTSVKK